MKRDSGRYVSPKRTRGLSISPNVAFAVVAIVAMCVLFFCFLFSHGELIERYFFFDTRDTGMDFFHSIEYVRGKAPYEIFNTLYPPLANLMFYVIYWLVPPSVSSQWTMDFWESIAMRGSYLDLRTHQAPLLIFMLFVLLSAWMTMSLCTFRLKRESGKHANLVALCMLFSPGMLFALERGNILLLVIPLTLFFVVYRNSDNGVVRELALLALAVAAGLKLYPAFFGVLLLWDKKYMRAVRAIIYGVLMVVLPMLFFNEGLAGIPMWLKIVFRFGEGAANPWIGTGFASILHRVALYINNYWGIAIDTSWFSVAGIMVAMVLLIISLGCVKEWQSVLAITMAVIMFQTQGGYIFGFLMIPMVIFLSQEKVLKKDNFLPFLLMTLLLVHLPLFYTRNVSYPDVAFKQLISLVLVLWCIIDTVAVRIKIKTESKS